MLIKFKDKKQYRLPGYDYSGDGYYFITICTRNREHFFGKVMDGRMRLSPIGKIAKYHWRKIPKRFSGIHLDEFIVMPNHLHGIIIIDNCRNAPCRNAPRRVPTIRPLIKNSLSSIINHYKGAVKNDCKRKGFEYFNWQSRFYDHIIRNEKSLANIQKYIINNPLRWDLDRNNPENLFI